MLVKSASWVARCALLLVFALARAVTASAAKGPRGGHLDHHHHGGVGGVSIDKQPFGTLPNGTAVDKYTLSNADGMSVSILTYGGIIQSLSVPDAHGRVANVTLGFSDLAGYLSPAYVKANPYFGAIIGRYGNRIGGAKFTLNGTTYTLDPNNNGNMLHGGFTGFDKIMWTAAPQTPKRNSVAIKFSLLSKEGDPATGSGCDPSKNPVTTPPTTPCTTGFPGDVSVTVTYTLDNRNRLHIDYSAVPTKDTVLNLTNHAYWNLHGEGSGTIYNHRLRIAARRYTPVDDVLVPTGGHHPGRGTPLDFRRCHAIGGRIRYNCQQLVFGRG